MKFNISKTFLKFFIPKKKNIKKYLIFTGILIFIYVYIAGDYGIYQLISDKREEKRLKKEIEILISEQEKLKNEKEMIEKGDLNVIEKIAREKYGLVKEGEKVFRIDINEENR